MTREAGLESPKAIVESSDADISFNVSVESSPVEYDRKAPKRVIKHHGHKMMYPSNCAESPGTSNDPDYVPELVELSEQRQIGIVCTYLFNFNLCLKGNDHAKQIVHDVKRIFQELEMKKLEDLFVIYNFENKYLKSYCVEKL